MKENKKTEFLPPNAEMISGGFMRIAVINIILAMFFMGCGKTKVDQQDSGNTIELSDELKDKLSADTASNIAFSATTAHSSPDTQGTQPDNVLIKRSEIEGHLDKASVEIFYLTGDKTHAKLTERFIVSKEELGDMVSQNERTYPYERATVDLVKKIRDLKQR